MDKEFYVSVDLYVSAKAAAALRKVSRQSDSLHRAPPCLGSRLNDVDNPSGFLMTVFIQVLLLSSCNSCSRHAHEAHSRLHRHYLSHFIAFQLLLLSRLLFNKLM